MLQGHFYNKTIRKIVAAFGTMFNNVTLAKYDPATMDELERVKVPLSYSNKEKFLYSLAYDETLTKPIQVQIARMAFEMTGMQYDPSRKLPSNIRLYNPQGTDVNTVSGVLMPVPYDFFFNLHIYTRNIEDMSQIVEQIVPYFTPDYTVSVSVVVDNNGTVIKRDIPIIIGPIDPQIEYSQDGNDPRRIIYTLTFTMKAYLFGPLSNASIIRKAITNIYDTVGQHDEFHIVMDGGGAGTFRFEEEAYVGESYQNALWTGRVGSWSNTTGKLTVYDVKGSTYPQMGQIVNGLDSGARWSISSTSGPLLLKHAQTTITPIPANANAATANVSFSFDTKEFPNIP